MPQTEKVNIGTVRVNPGSEYRNRKGRISELKRSELETASATSLCIFSLTESWDKKKSRMFDLDIRMWHPASRVPFCLKLLTARKLTAHLERTIRRGSSGIVH